MLAACPLPDSMTSGYRVPWTRNCSAPSPSSPAPRSRATSSKTRMNSSPMRLRLTSGSSTPASASKNRSCGLHVDELDVELAAERVLDLLALPRAHEPGVDVDADELVADRLVHERRGDRGVDAARQRAQHAVAEPTWSRIRATWSSMIETFVQVGGDLADVVQERARAAPGRTSVWATSGWNWTPKHRRCGVLHDRDRDRGGRRGHGEAAPARGSPRRRGSSRRRSAPATRRASADAPERHELGAAVLARVGWSRRHRPRSWASSWAP